VGKGSRPTIVLAVAALIGPGLLAPAWGDSGARAELSGPVWTVDRARFEPVDASAVGIDGLGDYRGALEVANVGGALAAVNDVGLDGYLAGISEMPASWPPEALRAQAIAARTYALSRLDRPTPADLAQLGAQLCATDACQVYAGLTKEHSPGASAWTAAVADTEGEVLQYRGRPIDAEYSSSNGGQSVDGGQPYLRPVNDPDDAVSPLHRWQVTLGAAELAAGLGVSGSIQSVSRSADTVSLVWWGPAPGGGVPPPASSSSTTSSTTTSSSTSLPGTPSSSSTTTSSSTRPTTTVTTAALPPPGLVQEALSMSADDFTHTLNQALPAPGDRNVLVPSARFSVRLSASGVVLDGIGFGHGVGMSQYGALGKALRGMKAAEILASYYGGLRPQAVPASLLPSSVRVALATGLARVRITGRFRLLDGAGRELITVGDGPWTLLPGPGSRVRIVAPPGYDHPFSVQALGLVGVGRPAGQPLTLRYRLPVPAMVSITERMPEGGQLTLPAATVDAGDAAAVLPAPTLPGEYHVAIAATAGAGRAAAAPLTFIVDAPAPGATVPVGPAALVTRPHRPRPFVIGVLVATMLLVAVTWLLLGADRRPWLSDDGG